MEPAAPPNLLAAWAEEDITPEGPVSLFGQYYRRISRAVRDPLTVTALAFEQKSDSGRQQAVMISIDLCYSTREFLDELRKALPERIPDLDPRALTVNATHIHSGPPCGDLRLSNAPDEIPQVEVRHLLIERTLRAIATAWGSRRPAGVSAADADATVGHCRRVLYAEGHAEMYGDPSAPDCIGIEAGSDNEVRLLFTWDEQRRLTGVIVNVACPAQVMEAGYVVSADFFGELRRLIRLELGADVRMLAQVSAAGDMSPRDLPSQAKDDINYWGESGMLAIARRLMRAVKEGLERASPAVVFDAPLRHEVAELVLPLRRVTKEAAEEAQKEIASLARGHPDLPTASQALFGLFEAATLEREKHHSRGPYDNKEMDFVQLQNALAVVRRFETQNRVPGYAFEMHAIRVGESAWITNPFELFLDFGHMIRARSRARRTFLVQLANDAGGYLPTARAVAGGGYSALVVNGQVGPDGGVALVEASARAIDQLWRRTV